MAAKKKTKPKTSKKTKSKAAPKRAAKKAVKKAVKKVAKKVAKKTAKKSVTESSLLAVTGKSWAEWFQILDDAGAAAMKRSEIAALLKARHAVTGWWNQIVTAGYEKARDLRGFKKTAQKTAKKTAKTLNASMNRTLEAGRDAASAAFDGAAKQATVLKDAMAASTRKVEKNLRAAWGNGSKKKK